MAIYVLPALVLLLLALFLYGRSRWKGSTSIIHQRLRTEKRDDPGAPFNKEMVEGLPEPVRRYLQKVIVPQSLPIGELRMRQAGSFNMSETGERWRKFTADQTVVTERPGFLWHARMRVLPGVGVRVHDAYVGGEGILTVSLLGAVQLAQMRDTEAVAGGELLRYLAEAPWYPTALLPRPGIEWTGIDESSARVTLTDGELTVSMVYTFGDDGLVSSVQADARGRAVGGKVIPTPWRGEWWGYSWFDGILVPTAGEVSWILPEGPKPYWRGEVTSLSLTFRE